MNADESLRELRKALRQLRESGKGLVPIHRLENFLDELQALPSASTAGLQQKHEMLLAKYDAEVKSGLEMFKSVIEAGREALNAAVLINGGAVVALLGFIGASVSKGLSPALGHSLGDAILRFGLGVLSAAVAYGLRYLTQYSYSGRWVKVGTGFNVASMVLGIAAYVFFALGLFGAVQAFDVQFEKP